MKRFFPFLIALLLLGSENALAADSELPFQSLQQFQHSAIATPFQELIRNPGELSAFWQRHAPGQALPAEFNQVDFHSSWLLAVSAGQRPTGGYASCVAKIAQTENGLQVYLKNQDPPSDVFLPMVQTEPGCLVSFPRQKSDKITFVAPQAREKRTLLTLRKLVHTSNSLILEPRQVIVRDLESFRLLWKEHNANNMPLPEVDFTKEMVIAVFMGEQPTGGYDLSIQAVSESQGQLQVVLQQTRPSNDMMVIQMLSAPADFVAVPARDLPVIFTETQSTPPH